MNPKFVYGDKNVQVPAHLHFGQFILHHLQKWNDKVAFEYADTGAKITYKEIAQYAVNLAESLKNIGVGRGDTVALGSDKCNEYIPTLLAIALTGATHTPYYLDIGRFSLKHKLNIVKPKYFISSINFWLKYKEVLKSFDCIQTFFMLDDNNDGIVSVKSLASKFVDIDLFETTPVQGQIDTAVILYSSGTTGMPKGVQLTHLNCILNSLPPHFSDQTLQKVFILGEWYHNYDTFMTYRFLIMGKKIIYVHDPSPVNFLNTVELYGINIAFLVPAVINGIIKMEDVEKYNLNSLKIIYSRGCLLHTQIIQQMKTKLPKLVYLMQGYGMTEAGELTSEFWGNKGPKLGSVGKASPGIILKVIDPVTNEILGPNQRGEICLKGPVLMKDYKGIKPSLYLDEEDFLKTGDLGYYDDEKYFYIVDRLKEIISYGGDKVSPSELETLILFHPAVKEVSVVGKPHPEFNELSTAFVVKQPGFKVTEQDIIDFVVGEVPYYMELHGGVRFIDELPKNSRGKVLRRVLRNLVEQED